MNKIILTTMACLLSYQANATTLNFVDFGSYSKDPISDLEWLDLSFTQNQSFNEVSQSLSNTNNTFAGKQGWRYATAIEFMEVFTSRGIQFSGSSLWTNGTGVSTHINDPIFAQFVDLVGITLNSSTTAGSRGILGDSIDGLVGGSRQIMGTVRFDSTSGRNYADLGLILDGDKGLVAGSYLVRQSDGGTSPIPESETYALLLYGLGIFGFINRKRKVL